MLTLTRDTKRLTIIAVYLLLFLVLGTGTYFLFRPAPSCDDGIQNQDERGVDCGGICAVACIERVVGADLLVREITFIPTDNGQYDVLARIFNPNNDIGAASFDYVLSLRDGSGQEIGRVTGKTSILPQETKTLLAFNITPSATPGKAAIEMSNFDWERLADYREKPALNVYEKRYAELRAGVGFSEATGVLINDSPYDFRSLLVKVILRDTAGKPLAANQTEMRTVTVGEQRSFRLLWPKPFPGQVARVDIEVDADVYASDNFIRQYLPRGRFQEGTPAGNGL
jgi:hypothetical protein